MKVFYDWEFIERGRMVPIEPVSVGMVAEDGTRLYRINGECLGRVVHHPWLRNFVVPFLPIKMPSEGIFEWDTDHEEYQFVAPTVDQMAEDVLQFLRGIPDLELWGYYAAYDHVCLAQLFGPMNELPTGIPMFTHDLQQHWEYFGRDRPLPPEPWNAHHAMRDAQWAHDAYRIIQADVATVAIAATADGEVIEAEVES